MSKNNRKTGDLTTVATVVNSANGRTGSRSDSDDGQKNRTLKRASKGQVDIDEAELLAGLGEVRQHDDEQIVFQVVQETADGQHQIVGQLCSEDGTPIGVESEEAGQGTEESEEKQELTDEELQKELQFLLDSQLEGQRNEDESEVAKHLITNREQLHEDDTDGQAEDQQDILDQTDAAVPNKGFSISEIQAFMNNQIKKQHQQQVLDEENENHLQLQQAASSQGQQRHIILVTENGDKIILLQNSSDMENDENSESMVDYQPQIDLDPEEEAHIQTVARERQAAFVSQLEILREKHKRTLHIDVLTPQVPHLQPIKLVPYPKNGLVSTGDEGVEPWTPPNAGSSKRRPPPRTPASVASKQRPSLVNSKAREEVEEPRAPIDLATAPKWLEPVLNYLNIAQEYVKQREQKVDDVAKFVPSASQSFQERCQDIKNDFQKIDCDIEQFKSIISHDLNDATNKYKALLKDHRLEEVASDMDAVETLEEEAIETLAKKPRLEEPPSQPEPTEQMVQVVQPNQVQEDHDDNDIIKELQHAARTASTAKASPVPISMPIDIPISVGPATASPIPEENGHQSDHQEEEAAEPMELETEADPEPKSEPVAVKAVPAAKKASQSGATTVPAAMTTPNGRPKREATSRTPKWDTIINSRGTRKSSPGSKEPKTTPASDKKRPPRQTRSPRR